MPLISICVVSGRTRVSSWTWSEGVVVVLPVAIRSAAFCVRWSFSMCVVAVSGDQAVWAYVRMGLMNCLYSVVMSSLECP